MDIFQLIYLKIKHMQNEDWEIDESISSVFDISLLPKILIIIN